jgi:hypothetical protein
MKLLAGPLVEGSARGEGPWLQSSRSGTPLNLVCKAPALTSEQAFTPVSIKSPDSSMQSIGVHETAKPAVDGNDFKSSQAYAPCVEETEKGRSMVSVSTQWSGAGQDQASFRLCQQPQPGESMTAYNLVGTAMPAHGCTGYMLYGTLQTGCDASDATEVHAKGFADGASNKCDLPELRREQAAIFTDEQDDSDGHLADRQDGCVAGASDSDCHPVVWPAQTPAVQPAHDGRDRAHAAIIHLGTSKSPAAAIVCSPAVEGIVQTSIVHTSPAPEDLVRGAIEDPLGAMSSPEDETKRMRIDGAVSSRHQARIEDSAQRLHAEDTDSDAYIDVVPALSVGVLSAQEQRLTSNRKRQGSTDSAAQSTQQASQSHQEVVEHHDWNEQMAADTSDEGLCQEQSGVELSALAPGLLSPCIDLQKEQSIYIYEEQQQASSGSLSNSGDTARGGDMSLNGTGVQHITTLQSYTIGNSDGVTPGQDADASEYGVSSVVQQTLSKDNVIFGTVKATEMSSAALQVAAMNVLIVQADAQTEAAEASRSGFEADRGMTKCSSPRSVGPASFMLQDAPSADQEVASSCNTSTSGDCEFTHAHLGSVGSVRTSSEARDVVRDVSAGGFHTFVEATDRGIGMEEGGHPVASGSSCEQSSDLDQIRSGVGELSAGLCEDIATDIISYSNPGYIGLPALPTGQASTLDPRRWPPSTTEPIQGVSDIVPSTAERVVSSSGGSDGKRSEFNAETSTCDGLPEVQELEDLPSHGINIAGGPHSTTLAASEAIISREWSAPSSSDMVAANDMMSSRPLQLATTNALLVQADIAHTTAAQAEANFGDQAEFSRAECGSTHSVDSANFVVPDTRPADEGMASSLNISWSGGHELSHAHLGSTGSLSANIATQDMPSCIEAGHPISVVEASGPGIDMGETGKPVVVGSVREHSSDSDQAGSIFDNRGAGPFEDNDPDIIRYSNPVYAVSQGLLPSSRAVSQGYRRSLSRATELTEGDCDNIADASVQARAEHDIPGADDTVSRSNEDNAESAMADVLHEGVQRGGSPAHMISNVQSELHVSALVACADGIDMVIISETRSVSSDVTIGPAQSDQGLSTDDLSDNGSCIASEACMQRHDSNLTSSAPSAEPYPGGLNEVGTQPSLGHKSASRWDRPEVALGHRWTPGLTPSSNAPRDNAGRDQGDHGMAEDAGSDMMSPDKAGTGAPVDFISSSDSVDQLAASASGGCSVSHAEPDAGVHVQKVFTALQSLSIPVQDEDASAPGSERAPPDSLSAAALVSSSDFLYFNCTMPGATHAHKLMDAAVLLSDLIVVMPRRVQITSQRASPALMGPASHTLRLI